MKCTKCNHDKKDEDFPFKNKSRGKRSTICKVCQRIYKRIHYENNKESHYKRNDISQEKIKAFVKESKTECVICGEKEKACLDFHHLRDKRMDLARIHNFGSLKKAQEEIDKCIVLCANCHRKVHAGILEIPT